MKKKTLIIISIIAVLLIALIIRGKIVNAPTEKIILFEVPENYQEVIDNSIDPSSIGDFVETLIIEEPEEESNLMMGTWKGEMGGKYLRIVIEEINDNFISGYNQLANNMRPIKGTFSPGGWAQPCSVSFDAVLNEPGDDQWDGVFTITFVGYEDTDESSDGIECIGNLEGSEAVGTWKSNNGKLTREFTLIKE